ncbi:DUF1631 domain-containing protein [Massilia sp. P8910]|uniref:DUF1631 family protein n=1 Tax=Massilia antarctica TaxID=2765360 RepID=UPI001E5D5370|nr:DUF1631 family protein [Massilia antarctica]MCE3602247.1 DUF1631 domain-containing protein [Massilia antarctica]
MAPPSPSVAAARKTGPSRHELLEALVATVTKHANDHLMAVSTRLVAALLDVTDPALDARTVFQRVKSGNLLKNNTYAFFHVAAAGIARAMRAEVDILLPPLKKTALALPSALELVPYEEMDSRVAFDAISRPFEMQYATQIATLNVRLGFLLERDVLRISQNPFRPEMFLSALHQAWREFEPDEEAHGLILPMLRPSLLFDFAPMYDALCDLLMNKGVQPGSVDAFKIKKTESAAAAKKARASGQAELAKQLRQFLRDDDDAPGSGFDIPMIPDLPAMASSGGGWRPSGAAAFQGAPGGDAGHAKVPAAPWHGGPAPQGGAPGQGSHAAGGAPGQGGIAAGGFAPASFTGGGIAAGGFGHAMEGGQVMVPASLLEVLKGLQGRLPEQFSNVAPTPAEAQAGNVFYLPRLKESIPKGSLSRGDESTIDLLSKIFETVLLDPNIPKDSRDLIQSLQIPVLKAALADKNFFFEETHPARRMIDLMSTMGLEQRSGPDDPLFQVMQRSVERVGRDQDDGGAPADVFSEVVAELEETMKAEETAAASAIAAPIAAALRQEKVTAATRSARSAVAARVGSGQVVAMLETFLENKWTSVMTVAYSVEDDKPGAVGNATKTMDELIWSVKPKITHEQRRDLIGKLPSLLATLNKWLDVIKWQDADRIQFFADLAECHASIVRAPLDITPERQLEIAVEVAQQDAMRRLEKENEALAAAEQAAHAELDDAELGVDALERNMWIEFTDPDGSIRKVKLAWISPLRTLYIFSTGARQEAFSLSSDKLIEAYRAQRVRLMRVEGVVSRALSQAMDEALSDSEKTHSVAA